VSTAASDAVYVDVVTSARKSKPMRKRRAAALRHSYSSPSSSTDVAW